jgi:hypothetical protein
MVFIIIITVINMMYYYRWGHAAGGAVGWGWGSALQGGRPRFRFPVVSFEFFIDIIHPTAL